MSKDDIINNIPQCPGIYMIQNNINNFKYDKHRQRGAVSPHKG